MAQPAKLQAKLETIQIKFQPANLFLQVDPAHELLDGVDGTV